MIYLVSYNHSGNTWLRYCMEYITKKPTLGHRKFSISERKNNALRININDNPIAIKRHEIRMGEIRDKDIFVLILRKPNECIKIDQNVSVEFLKYYSLIQHYKQHRGKKFLFHYNELFDKHILSWLRKIYKGRIYKNRLNDLKSNWADHQKKCIGIYKNKRNKKGANLKAIPEILLQDNFIRCIL